MSRRLAFGPLPWIAGFIALLCVVAALIPVTAADSSEPADEPFPEATLESSDAAEALRESLRDAVIEGDFDRAEELLDSGADASRAVVHAARAGDNAALQWLFDRGVKPDGRQGGRALLFSFKLEDPSTYELLLANGADVNASDDAGISLLMMVATAQIGRSGTLHWLLESGADPDQQSLAGRTALMFSVKAERPKVIRQLLDGGADVDLADSDGWTPLMLASRNGKPQLVSLLLEGGADPDRLSGTGWSPLMLAAWEGHLSVIERLLEDGADPNLASYGGGTALLRAVQSKQALTVTTLVDAGADPEALFAGLTVKQWARTSGQTRIWQLLKQVSQ